MSDSLLIPDDLSACQTLIGELAATVAEQSQTIEQQGQTIQEQKLTIDELIRRAFIKRSERYIEDPNQLKIDFGDTDEAADAADGLSDALAQAETIVGEHKRRKQLPKKPRNEQLPEHLERYEVELDVPDDVKHCDQHGERTLIGHDRQESLEYIPPKLRVRVTLIPKFACPGAAECGVSQPLRPQGLVEGNRYDTSVAAQVITGKFGYHLPIYRQQDYFAGSDQPFGRCPDPGPFDVVEPRSSRGGSGQALHQVLAWRSTFQRTDRHRRHASDVAVTAGDS